MTSSDRVIVAVPKSAGEVVGVFETDTAFEDWLEDADWSRDQLNVRDCRVRPER